MTRQELRTRMLRALHEDPTSPVFWSTTEADGYLAEALDVIAEEAPAFKRTFTLPRRAGTQIYSLAGVGTDILAPYRVWLPDLKRRLEAKTLADLDARHERWLEVTGEPWWWYPVSWDQFGIWPAPTTGEGWLHVDCYCWAPALLDDDDEPELHPSQHDSLAVYGEWLGALKQWDAQRAVQRLQQFLVRHGQVRSQEGIRQVQETFWVRGEHRADHRR